MKKLITLFTGLLMVAVLNAQSLDDIVKKYTAANKYDVIDKLSTIKITAKMSMMGMDIPMQLLMKKPDKIRTEIDFNGQQMITAFDGKKGYTLNPMTGSTTPVEMTADEIRNAQGNNMFKNQLADYHKEGKLTLLGEEAVNGKPAFKIKVDMGSGNTSTMFIDKETYMLSKNTANITAQGVPVTSDSYFSDYKEMSGLIIPMKTTISAQGMDMMLTFDKVEVDVPIDDSVFTLK